MPLLLGLDGWGLSATDPAVFYLSRQRMLIYLVSPSRTTEWRIGQWTALSIEKEEHDAGSLSISAPMNAGWITDATADSAFDVMTGWEEYSIDVYIDGICEWSGPIVNRRFAPGQSLHANPTVTFTAETFTQHFARRRANNSTNKADITYTDQADDIIRQALRNCNGTVTPTGYPGGVSRGDFNSWTVTVQADTGAAGIVSVSEQDGNNVWGFVTHVANKGDCYIYTDGSTPATWDYRVRYPYVVNDKTGTIFLTPAGGSVTSYALEYSLLDIVNVAAVKGSGSGSSQIKGWQQNATSVGLRGVYEGEATLPSAASTTYTDTEGTAILAAQATPTNYIEVEIRSTAAAQFTYHPSATAGQYGMRDTISIVLPQLAAVVEATVRGWRIEQEGPNAVRESIRIGNIRPSVLSSVARGFGFPGPFSAGSRFRSNSG